MDLATELDKGLRNPNAEQLAQSVRENLSWAGNWLERLLAVTGRRDVENTLALLNNMWMHLDVVAAESELLAAVHPEAAVREAAERAEAEVSRFVSELQLNRPLFEAVQAVDLTGASDDTRFWVEKMLRDFRRAGVDRDEATRERVKKLDQELVEIGQKFRRAISEDVRALEVTDASELAGLPEDVVERFKEQAAKEGRPIHISTDYTDYVPVLKYVHHPSIRRDLFVLFRNRAFPDNVETLNRLLAKRHEKATLLGFTNWVGYATADKMIATEKNAREFVEKAAKITRERAKAEIAELLKFKTSNACAGPVGRVEEWESSYLMNLLRKKKYEVDAQETRKYFDLPRVRRGLFDLTAKLFDVRIEEAKGLTLWHEEVTAWNVLRGGEIIGRFYLDLHPRDKKYKHAACFGYREGVRGRRLPQAVLVCNFPKPGGKPGDALMEHGDVVTFFHEFGHLMHALLGGHQPWIRNSGISTEWDFVEVPSQLYEEWAWNAEALRTFARHFQTGESIPEDLVRRMREARDFGKALMWAQQAWYARLALEFHGRDPARLNLDDRFRTLHNEYAPFLHVDGTHFYCSFGHLDQYSAIYYTYIWSKVITCDFMMQFERGGWLNPEMAKRYRDTVLAPGGSKKAEQLVRDFLGRDFCDHAFEAYLAA